MRSSPVYFGSAERGQTASFLSLLHTGSSRCVPSHGLASKASSKLVITSAAFQDHITRSLLFPHFSPEDPLWKYKWKSTRKRVEVNGLQTPDQQEETEYKLGLVASPAERLTEEDWTRVKMRSVHHGDSAQPCSICREEFHLHPQVFIQHSRDWEYVITHLVFHRRGFGDTKKDTLTSSQSLSICLREVFWEEVLPDVQKRSVRNPSDSPRSAPVQTPMCHQDSSMLAGLCCPKRYRELRKSSCPKDKRLRRQFFEAKLQELNDSFVRYCHTDTEAFLSEIDRSLSSSRRVFEQLKRKHVIQRGVKDCPICLTALSIAPEAGSSSQSQRRHTVMLSCSHLFHQICLEAFESFSTENRPSCPLCRSVYCKKLT
ncbi:RING finger protein 32 [Dissostichus eleginoides]|uniref:RING finger protein 32 n=1 Tax=Dissostichus eleginoides TaxID=100907 RepID=A0AAD9EXQ5_DISEL|nr:RING finger protein 32 [Dissostichus eleginoides]